MLWKAVQLGAPAIDIELLASEKFLDGQTVPESTTLIMSNHNYTFTPSLQDLQEIEQEMRAKGAKVAKLATTANDVTDALTMINLLQQRTGDFSLPVKALVACSLHCCLGGVNPAHALPAQTFESYGA